MDPGFMRRDDLHRMLDKEIGEKNKLRENLHGQICSTSFDSKTLDYGMFSM